MGSTWILWNGTTCLWAVFTQVTRFNLNLPTAPLLRQSTYRCQHETLAARVVKLDPLAMMRISRDALPA